MGKKIVIIENDWNHFKKIRDYLAGYSCYPDIDCTDESKEEVLNDFIETIVRSLNPMLSNENREAKKREVIMEISKYGNDVIAYIIDYELYEGQTSMTGLEFYKQFIDSKEIYPKTIPCLMITHIGGNHYNDIVDYKEKINDVLVFDCYQKPAENDSDTMLKERIKKFVENAYPRVKYANEVFQIAFEYHYDKVKGFMDDIINNPDTYDDNIDNILLNCIEYKSNRDKKFIESLLFNLAGAKK